MVVASIIWSIHGRIDTHDGSIAWSTKEIHSKANNQLLAPSPGVRMSEWIDFSILPNSTNDEEQQSPFLLSPLIHSGGVIPPQFSLRPHFGEDPSTHWGWSWKRSVSSTIINPERTTKQWFLSNWNWDLWYHWSGSRRYRTSIIGITQLYFK